MLSPTVTAACPVAPARQLGQLLSSAPTRHSRAPDALVGIRRAGRRSVARKVAEKESKEVDPEDKGLGEGYVLDEPTLEERLSEWLPEREPGEFPRLGVHPLGWTGMVSLDEDDEFDPLRDGPLRYLGYANELGEAFNAWLPAGGVPASYAVAIAYVLIDTIDKGFQAKQESIKQLSQNRSGVPQDLNVNRLATVLAAERSIDTIVWQLLASVAIPGFTIHQVVAITHGFLDPHLQHLSAFELEEITEAAAALHVARDIFVAAIDKIVPTAMGLFTIPFIVEPIDETVHLILDKTLRPSMNRFICTNMRGKEAGLDMCYVPDEE